MSAFQEYFFDFEYDPVTRFAFGRVRLQPIQEYY